MDLTLDTLALTSLGHPGRLAVFRLLARRAPDGVRPSEIAEALSLKPNTLSVYVTNLTRAGLLQSWREGKSVFYSIDLDRVGALIDFLVNDCCRGRPELCSPLAVQTLKRLDERTIPAPDHVINVLFTCTGNSARSIFAEAILSFEGAGKFNTFSAGTQPYSEINPHAVAILESLGHDVSELRAKNVSEFQSPNAPRMDFVFTVCDQAANQECSPWPGQPISAHWGMDDPVKIEGTDTEKAQAFRNAYDTLKTRLTRFSELPLDTLDRISLQNELDQISRTGNPLLQSANRKR